MICPKCKRDIPVESDFCPECGARQTQKERQKRGLGKKVVAVLLGCLVISSVLSVIFGGNDTKSQGTAGKSVETVQAADQEPQTTQSTQKSQATQKPKETQKPQEAKKPQPSANPLDDDIIDVDIDGCHVTYEGHEIVRNLADELCVAVYYTFTNNTTENKAFDFTVQDQAFQNGVELDYSMFHVNDYSKTSSSELQPGVSATVCSAFVLKDTSNVELQVYPWISFDKKPSDAMLLSLDSEE